MIALLNGVSGAWAQRTVTVGAQITNAANIVSGRAYLLQHQGNGSNKPWIEDKETYYNCPNSSGNCNTASVWYLIDNGDGTWKIKNCHTGKYWPKPTGNANLVGTTEASAGSWTLNMSDGVAAPTCNGYKLNRNTPNLVGWNTGTGTVTQMKIYEVVAYNTIEETLQGKLITVGDAVSSITADTWYVIKCNTPEDGGYYRGTVFESPGALYHNGNTSMDKGVKWLFRFEDAGETNKYYIKTAYGNYWTDFTDQAQIGTRTGINGKEKVTVAKINSTDGHFYFQSNTTSVIMDANGLTSGTASGNVVGWSTTVPTSTGGNNDWGVYEVSITDFAPTASEVYTINNTCANSSNQGAMMYSSTKSSKYVWSSGKDETFDASSDNCRWIFYPTGTSNQYYLYNIGAQKFAIPSSANSTASWIFSSNAVAVTPEVQLDGTVKLYTSTGSLYCSVSNGYGDSAGPIINYNDDGAKFTITKVDNTSSSVTTQLTAAVNKLIDSQGKLTAKPASDGWFAIKIQSCTNDASYANNYLYTLTSEYYYNPAYYPLAHANIYKLRPAIDDAIYYFRITESGSYYMIQLPNGRFIKTDGSYFPISGTTGTTVDINYNDASGYFTFIASSKYADAYNNFIGETGTANRTKYDIYPINLTTAGLTAWTVTITNGTGSETITCNRADVSGLTSVYNNGYFFLPTGTTPLASEFSAGSYDCQITINSEDKTITATLGHSFALNKVGENSWATLSLTYDATIQGYSKSGGALVYTVSIAGERAQLESAYTMAHVSTVNEIPANTGVLVCYPTPGETAAPTIFATKATAALSDPIPTEGNALQANPTDKTSLASNEYVFGTSSGELGFWKLGEGKKLGANKAYLVYGEAEVKGYVIDFSNMTGIKAVDNVERTMDNAEIFNLAGQRMSRLQKGVNIVNGKKVILK